MQYCIEKHDCVPSTNDLAKERAIAGAPAGLVLVANRQTKGRGRMGRTFHSEGGGLYMSILFRPTEAAEDALALTTRAAVAVAKAIEKHTGRSAEIKWVNDVYQNGRKVCGILAEGQANASGKMDFVVLGIGINLFAPKGGFPEALRNIAGALFFEGESFDKDAILSDILENLAETDVYAEYVKRDMLIGKTVTVLSCGEPLYSAEVLGIDRDFSLRIRTSDGETRLRSGEVSVKPV